MTPTVDRVIDAETTHSIVAARGAAIDAIARSKQALRAHADFFDNPAHQAKIKAVQDVVEGFFKVHGGFYVNHRENRGKPFTTVKLVSPAWPKGGDRTKEASYLKPLRDMGVEIVFSKRSNSYLYHVR